jgi:hypothetical protein
MAALPTALADSEWETCPGCRRLRAAERVDAAASLRHFSVWAAGVQRSWTAGASVRRRCEGLAPSDALDDYSGETGCAVLSWADRSQIGFQCCQGREGGVGVSPTPREQTGGRAAATWQPA